MTALRLAVFDCDGTLVDSQHSIVAAMVEAFQRHDHPVPTPGAVTRLVGLPLVEAIARLLPEHDNPACEAICETYKAVFYEMRQAGTVQEPLFEGIVDALDALEAEGWLLGVATGKAYRGLKATLGDHGLLDRFVTCQTADRAHGKPHPDMMLKAMAETGATAENTVMIGDTTFDIEMAVNAGTRAIGVGWGYHANHELTTAGAERVVTAAEELLHAITKSKEMVK